MKNIFSVSLCKNGILGGWIVIEAEAMTYRTGKVTIPEKYRNLKMKYSDMVSITEGNMFIFPTVTVRLMNGEEYKFLVYAKKKFLETLNEMREK